jgi:hypothetical protein
MNLDRIRLSVEVIGIAAIVLSLMFVGLELKQTRDMNLAQLHYDRLSLYFNHQLAVLESEPALALAAKRSEDVIWDSAGFTDLERGAAITQAQLWLQDWWIAYQFIDLGFSVKSLNSLKTDIRVVSKKLPEIEAVFKARWLAPGYEEYSMTGLLSEVYAERASQD